MAISGMTVVADTVKETMAVAIMLTRAGRMVVRNGNVSVPWIELVRAKCHVTITHRT